MARKALQSGRTSFATCGAPARAGEAVGWRKDCCDVELFWALAEFWARTELPLTWHLTKGFCCAYTAGVSAMGPLPSALGGYLLEADSGRWPVHRPLWSV
jgi:hypothetical protein